EGFTQDSLVELIEGGWGHPVAERPLLALLQLMLLHAQQLDELIRLLVSVCIQCIQDTALLELGQPLCGSGLTDAIGEGKDAGRIDERREPLDLEVDRMLLIATPGDPKTL